jgi:hypothetical protein
LHWWVTVGECPPPEPLVPVVQPQTRDAVTSRPERIAQLQAP